MAAPLTAESPARAAHPWASLPRTRLGSFCPFGDFCADDRLPPTEPTSVQPAKATQCFVLRCAALGCLLSPEDLVLAPRCCDPLQAASQSGMASSARASHPLHPLLPMCDESTTPEKAHAPPLRCAQMMRCESAMPACDALPYSVVCRRTSPPFRTRCLRLDRLNRLNRLDSSRPLHQT
jgi:hypothetical protein